MFDIIANFLGEEALMDIIINAPDLYPIVIQRIFETSCVVYCLLLVMIYLVVYTVFRAFLKRA